MSLKIGQIVSSKDSSINLIPLENNIKDRPFSVVGKNFKDTQIDINLESDKNYALNMIIQLLGWNNEDKNLNIKYKIKLIEDNYSLYTPDLKNNYQIIDEGIISKTEKNINCSFTPNIAGYTAILIEIDREEEFDTRFQIGVKTEGTKPSLTILNNIINNISNIKAIGIQAAPGTQFCLNGEIIMIGRSGVFSLSDDNFVFNFITINSNDYILDYKYEE